MSPTYELVHACPACGAGHLVTVVGDDVVRSEVESLWSFHTRRIHGDTPPQRLLDRAAFSQRPPVAIAACTACGTLVRNPREAAESLRDTYADATVEPAALTALLAAQRATFAAQARRLRAVLGRRGRVLEVGTYLGGFLEAAQADGWQAHGIDVNVQAVELARARGLNVQLGTLEDVEARAAYDAIAFWNVFEQLDEPRAALAEASVRLRAGGIVVVRVPNGAFYRRLHRTRRPLRSAARAALALNNLLAFPYRHGFTVAGLRALFERAGLRTIRVHGDTLVRTADTSTRWWARMEEAVVKGGLRTLLRGPRAPWLEAYGARR